MLKPAVRNVIEADYPTKRTHPYGKPPEIFETLFPRVCVAGDPRGGGKHFGETRHRKRRHRRMLAQAMNGSACDAASGAD